MPQDNVAVRIGKYRLSKTLGMGSFSRVKLAHREITGMKVAIKILDRNKIRSLDMDEKVRREIKILRELKHPHIVRLFEVIETPTEIFLVLEYVSNGELFDFIVMQGRVPEDLARRLFQQIISGVAFCHHHKIVHRDLKPENLLLSSDYTIKVADFGLSNIMLDGEFLRTSCGSPNYAAPEVIVGDLYAGPEVDVWSSGVILYALLCGSLPFDDEESIPRLFRKIKNGVYTLPAHLSEGARDLIPRMLMVDPINRITMDQIREHSWFKVRLPPYLQVSPCYQETVQEEEVDQEVLESIIAMDYPLFRDTPRHVFLTALTCEKTNVVRVTYDMLLDKKKNDERVEQTRLAAEAPNSRNPGGSGGVVIPGTGRAGNGSNVPASSAPTVRPIIGSVPSNSYGGYSGAPDSGSNHASPGSASTLPYGSLPLNSGQNLAFPGPRPHRPSRGSSHIRGRRWYLGIQSKKEPVHVMVEVFLALGNLACQWQYKSSHPYRLVCRWKPSRLGLVAPGSSGDQWVYLGLQLYKIQSNKDMGIYLLDFQRVGGISSAFQFMNLCSCIIHALKQPSHSRTNYSRHHRRPSASRSHRSTAPSPQQ